MIQCRLFHPLDYSLSSNPYVSYIDPTVELPVSGYGPPTCPPPDSSGAVVAGTSFGLSVVVVEAVDVPVAPDTALVNLSTCG